MPMILFGKCITFKLYRRRTDVLGDQNSRTQIKCGNVDCKNIPFRMTDEDFQMQSGSPVI